MSDDPNPTGQAADYRWRPAVAPFRARPLARLRPRRPLPGQLPLPGMEPPDEPAPASEDPQAPNAPGAALPAEPSLASPPAGTPCCPNCGGTQFDDDGDCTHCWEPAVARIVTLTEGTGRPAD